MSLIKCPECGKEFSSYAKECPVCGMPTSKIKVSEEQNINNSLGEQAKVEQKKKLFFTTAVIIKLVISIGIFVALNIYLIDETSTVSFGGLMLLNAIISYALGFVLTDYKWAFLTLLCGLISHDVP